MPESEWNPVPGQPSMSSYETKLEPKLREEIPLSWHSIDRAKLKGRFRSDPAQWSFQILSDRDIDYLADNLTWRMSQDPNFLSNFPTVESGVPTADELMQWRKNRQLTIPVLERYYEALQAEAPLTPLPEIPKDDEE